MLERFPAGSHCTECNAVHASLTLQYTALDKRARCWRTKKGERKFKLLCFAALPGTASREDGDDADRLQPRTRVRSSWLKNQVSQDAGPGMCRKLLIKVCLTESAIVTS
jgi:hypothetical protein